MVEESHAEVETDDYLIELIGLKADFPKEALAAYGEIYKRYWGIMYRVALRKTRDALTAQDLLADTFNMIYNRAHTFKKGKISTPDNVRKSIKRWMTTIMEHIFYDHYLDIAYKVNADPEPLQECYIIDKVAIAKTLDDDYENFYRKLEIEQSSEHAENVQISGSQESENLVAIKEYIDKLSDRDRDIVLTFYDYYIPGKYTPSEVLDSLVQKWKTTRENIRKILEKFKKSIKNELQAKIYIRK